MSKTFQLDIITPTKVINVGQVDYLRAPGTDGLFGVKASHAPATIFVGVGEVKVVINGKDNFYATSGGFADIQPESVLLLVETAENISEIDKDRADSSHKRALERVKDKKMDSLRSNAALARAKNRLQVSTR